MEPNSRYYGAAATYNKPKGGVPHRQIFVLIGGALIVVVLIAVIFIIFNAITSGPRTQLATLVAREQSLANFTAGNQTKLTSDTLVKINSEVTAMATSDMASLQTQLLSKYNLSAVPKDITALEADTTSAATLATATQSGKFDEAYKEILGKKINDVLQLSESVQQGTSGQLNASLEQAIQNMTTLQLELSSN